MLSTPDLADIVDAATGVALVGGMVFTVYLSLKAHNWLTGVLYGKGDWEYDADGFTSDED